MKIITTKVHQHMNFDNKDNCMAVFQNMPAVAICATKNVSNKKITAACVWLTESYTTENIDRTGAQS